MATFAKNNNGWHEITGSKINNNGQDCHIAKCGVLMNKKFVPTTSQPDNNLCRACKLNLVPDVIKKALTDQRSIKEVKAKLQKKR